MPDQAHPPTDGPTGKRTPLQPATSALPAPTSDAPTCPWCRSSDVEPLALFGSQLMTQQYYCLACHTPFERIKDSR